MAEFNDEKNQEELEELEEKMSDDEMAVVDIICENDVLDPLPDDFFVKNSVDQLNEYFGGHDNMVFTENVKEYCRLFKEFTDNGRDMVDEFYEMAEEERHDSIDDELDGLDISDEDREFIHGLADEDLGMFPDGFFTDMKNKQVLESVFERELTDDTFKGIGAMLLGRQILK